MRMSRDEWRMFLVKHCELHAAWKHPDSRSAAGRAFFTPWLLEFERLEIDFSTACAASERMVHQPPKFNRDHWTTLRRYALEEQSKIPGVHQVEAFDPDNLPVPPGEFRERFWALVTELRERCSVSVAPPELGRSRLHKPRSEVIDGDLILYREYGEIDHSQEE